MDTCQFEEYEQYDDFVLNNGKGGKRSPAAAASSSKETASQPSIYSSKHIRTRLTKQANSQAKRVK